MGFVCSSVRGRPKYLHNALNFQSDFPNLIDLRAIFSQSQGPQSQVLKGRKIPVIHVHLNQVFS